MVQIDYSRFNCSTAALEILRECLNDTDKIKKRLDELSPYLTKAQLQTVKRSMIVHIDRLLNRDYKLRFYGTACIFIKQ